MDDCGVISHCVGEEMPKGDVGLVVVVPCPRIPGSGGRVRALQFSYFVHELIIIKFFFEWPDPLFFSLAVWSSFIPSRGNFSLS